MLEPRLRTTSRPQQAFPLTLTREKEAESIGSLADDAMIEQTSAEPSRPEPPETLGQVHEDLDSSLHRYHHASFQESSNPDPSKTAPLHRLLPFQMTLRFQRVIHARRLCSAWMIWCTGFEIALSYVYRSRGILEPVAAVGLANTAQS